MSNKNYWFGYMEVGEKSSPVLRDNRIDTDNPDTLYLFNLNRNEILEYRRDIIEPKLRELKDDEQSLCDELQSAYTEARSGFIPRGGKTTALPTKEPARAPITAANDDRDDESELDDFSGADSDEDWLEEEEA